ncbi:clavaminate synthase-like protein At3g21360 [Macadamia integrifolia]|uniref:clavaminate synthase-like protein At3g21360 n=1 Tax=Macadamia integrifolia TaxID=60698 RepID=UPI001C4FCFED|nr:clavaminate synthase-like protein At3g21360 [Macadamia integrifolia]
MEFVEGKIEEVKVFEGGLVFPKTLNPPKGGIEGGHYGVNELVEMVREKQEWLSRLLQRHSAVLFRGFGIGSAEEFGKVVEAFGWEEMEYSGVTTRLKVADRVHTANEAPLHKFINFHHEMALMKQFPSKIFFFCAQPSPEGGETSIVPSHIIVEKMKERVPKFMTKLSEMGYVVRRSLPKEIDNGAITSKTWKFFLQTEDEDEAKKRAQERLPCGSINFNKDGSAELTYGPMNPVRRIGERKVWFNSILGYEDDFIFTFGDGNAIPSEAMDVYSQILNENCVDIKWQKGDILLLDNLAAQHARRPGKPPRAVLVSICK